MKLGTAFVEVRPDTKAFGRELEQQTTASAAQVGKNLAGVLAGGAFLVGAKKATDAASQLQQAVGGTSAVFGEAQGAVEDFAKGAAESAGLSERAARELTSTLGGLLKGFGYTEKEAADLSVTLAKLGADLAATFGGTPEEAVQALGAALRGETDPLERFGIALNQTLVNQKAVELGLAATTSAVDQHAKAQATLALITERSADAQGQFAREADTAAGQAAISAAKTENAAADLGENLLPIYTKLSETVGIVAEGFGALPEPVQTAVIALAGIAALSGPIKVAAEAAGSLAAIARARLSQGLDVAAGAAYDLSGNLGRVATGMGVLGAAFIAGSILLDQYQKDKARAAELESTYTDLLSEQSNAVYQNTAAFAGSELLKGDLGEKLRDAGINLSLFTDAIQNNADGLVEINDEFTALSDGSTDVREGLKAAGLEGTKFADELIRIADSGALTTEEIRELLNRINDQAEGYRVGAREAENKGEADEEAGVKAAEAAPKVEELADKLDLNEQAAKDAAESVDLFREAVEKALAPLDFQGAVDQRTKALQDIAAGIDERQQSVADARQRIKDLQGIKAEDRPDDFARQMADAQADLREALDATSLTLDGNSEAALRNRDELRGLVDDSVGVIEAAREQGTSLEDLQLIRLGEIQSLRDQLTQMGYNEDEIETYIDAIEEIPLDRTTVLSVDDAKAKIQLDEAIKRLQRQIDLNPLSIDVAGAERFAAGPRSVNGAPEHAAGGDVFDGDFIVGEAGVPELLRKRGSSVEVIAGAARPVGGGGFDAAVAALLAEQNALLAQIAGNTAGPTTGQRLRRVQTTAGAI